MARKVCASIICSRCQGLNDRAPHRATCQRCAIQQVNAAANEMLRREAEIFFASNSWKEQEKRL